MSKPFPTELANERGQLCVAADGGLVCSCCPTNFESDDYCALGHVIRSTPEPKPLVVSEAAAMKALGLSEIGLQVLVSAGELRTVYNRDQSTDYFASDVELLARCGAKGLAQSAHASRSKHLYAIEIDGVCTKIGISSNPLDRIASHARTARQHGRVIGRQWVSVAHYEAEAHERALMDGRNEYLAKPFDEVMALIDALPIRVREWLPALAMLALTLLPACAAPIPTTPGLPLFVHLCESMPAADAYAWDKAATAVNAELGDAVRVGNRPIPADATCSFVDVCPGEVETTEIAGACETLVRYPVGDTAEAKQVLWLLAAQGGV